MIDGINDTPEDAHAAADLLRGRLAHVNLIPMNPVAHTPWQPSPPERIEAFASVLRARGPAHDGAAQPGRRDRGGLRTARRRAGRRSRRRPPSRAAGSCSSTRAQRRSRCATRRALMDGPR